jgi:signal peptidase II
MSSASTDPSRDAVGDRAEGAASDARAAPPPRAWRSPVAWVLLLVVFSLGLVVDLWSKEWSFRTVAGAPVDLRPGTLIENPNYRLPWHEGVRAIPPDLLDFHLVLNQGAVFGIGQQRRGVFIALTAVAIVVGLAVFAFWTDRRAWVSHLAIGLILAGGVGNLYDRVTFGAVRDFLHLFPRRHLPFGFNWPGGSREIFPWVFNVADMLLLLGMALLLIQAWRADAAQRRVERSAAG